MKIQLPAFVVADLYKDTLVVLDEHAFRQTEGPVFTGVKTEDIPLYAGSNLQHICIVLYDTAHPFADEDSLLLLSNLLAALNYHLADAAIINYHRTPVDYTIIFKALQPRVCLLFGITTKALKLPFVIPDYQLQRFEECTFLQACAINEMKANDDKAKAEKRKLWNCLKSAFNK